MYFASADERRWIDMSLQQDARRLRVADELRGWRWSQPPLRPIYDVRLDPLALSGRVCPTGRDLYLAGNGVIQPASTLVDRSSATRSVAAAVIQEAKQIIQLSGAAGIDRLERRLEEAARRRRRLRAGASNVEADLWTVRAFELRRVLERVVDTVASLGSVGGEAIVAHALPIAVDVPVDGRFIGLGRGLVADAICWSEQMVITVTSDVSADPRRSYTTALALALESATGRPVDIGCAVAVRVVDGLVEVQRDYHLIGDEERQIFIEQRDDLARVVDNGADPGLPGECPAWCGYLSTCRPALVQLPQGTEKGLSANLPVELPRTATGGL